MLEAELLDMKANPHKKATGSIIESSLDKGRGYVATVLVQSGTLKVGDIVLAGQYFGHVKAMFNERGEKMEKAGPSEPALILGLNGAPQAGDKFNVWGTRKKRGNLPINGNSSSVNKVCVLRNTSLWTKSDAVSLSVISRN